MSRLPSLNTILEPLQCRLCRRIGGVVFISILLVEAAILIPSYFSYRSDLLDRLEHAGQSALSAAYMTQSHNRMSDLLLSGRMLSLNSPVVGGAFHDREGETIAFFGEAPESSVDQVATRGRRTAEGDRYEIYLSPQQLGMDYAMVARLDASWVPAELTAFVWRISGLVLIISIVVSATTMAIVGRKAMAPMLALRDHVARAHDDPARGDAHRFTVGGDEWKDVGESVDRLLARVARTYREDLAMMTAMADQASDAIVAYDDLGRVAYANSACRELVGCNSLEEMQQAGVPKVRLSENENDLPRPLPEAIADSRNGVQVTVQGVGGREVSCLIQVAQLATATAGAIRCYAHLTDISQLREAQDRLMQQNMELEAANRAKNEFLANISHELRTPLNAIIGFSELLRDQAFREAPDSRFREYTEDIHMSGRHLLSLINDILDLSKIEAGRFDLQESLLDVEEAMESAMRLVRGRSEAHDLTLETRVDETLTGLYADPRALKQILINLLSNAVKFTPAGGSVTLMAERRRDGGIDISVRDTGIGMDPDQVPTAFKPFSQLDSQLHRRFEGTGLGLSLVRSLADLHEAEVEVETAPERGTWITLHFPAIRSEDNPSAKAAG